MAATTRYHSTPCTHIYWSSYSHGSRAFCNRASSVGVTRNAGKRKAAAPSGAAASPAATNEAENSAVSSQESSASEDDSDDDSSVAGDSEAEVTRVTKPAVEKGSGLDAGADKPSALEQPLAVESGATVMWRKPKNKKSSLWAFFLQGTEKGKKRAKCTAVSCKKPVVMAQATSNLFQHMTSHHKNLPAFVEYVKTEAHKTVGKYEGHAKEGGIMGYMNRDESAVHQRLILGFLVGGHKSVSVVEEDGFKTMMRGFSKRPSLHIPCRKTMAKLVTHTAIVAREKLKAMSNGEDLCLTCDGWTSGNGLAMMGVTEHWIDKDWKLVCACFDVSELEGSHNGVR